MSEPLTLDVARGVDIETFAVASTTSAVYAAASLSFIADITATSAGTVEVSTACSTESATTALATTLTFVVSLLAAAL